MTRRSTSNPGDDVDREALELASPAVSRVVAWVTVVALVVGGCVAHETVGRPPSHADVERINMYAQEHGDLRLEYVTPLPSCAAGACGREGSPGGLPDEIAMIADADARETAVWSRDGRMWKVPTSAIAAATARSRSRGAAVGALIGVAVGVGLTAAFIALSESGGFQDRDPSAPPPSPTSAGDVLKVGLLLSVTQGLGWAGLGYLFGGRRSFDFEAPGSPPPARVSADSFQD
jgi:hypothetical protein